MKQQCREARGAALVESLFKDMRFALRTLRKSPVFSIAAISTLALGIGANTAIFQLLDSTFLRSLPVQNPGQLVTVQIRGGNGGFGISRDDQRLTYPLFEGIRTRQQGLSGVFAWADEGVRIGEAADTRDVDALYASGEFFSVLGIAPAAGRLLNTSDDYAGCAGPGVVLSNPFWQTAFAGREAAIGGRLVIQGHPLEIMGVAQAGFSGLEVRKKFDIALPICAQAFLHGRNQHFLRRDVFWMEGARMRFRPVMMTATVAALGLVPFLFATGPGSEVQRPLAIVVIGGLVTSSLLTLVAAPALYRFFDRDDPTPQPEEDSPVLASSA